MVTVFFGIRYNQMKSETEQAAAQQQVVQTNQKASAFLKLFTRDVLFADKEINFETRLTLENAVRDFGDPAILAMWQRFTSSANEREAQQAVKELMNALASRI